jgi:uncharacterized membrane protein YozB (DUF420 family)
MMGPQDLPSLNALLNGSSAALLTAGYVAVRRRRLRVHIACMLAALAMSGLFLSSYLYYHFAVRGGQPTSFRGEGWVRTFYFCLLLSHMVLAAATAPLALTTAYLGLRWRLQRHKRLARFTLPLWLYVSLTGVAVYWMLYRLYPTG